MRDDATRMKLSPSPRAFTRVPQTQSKFFQRLQKFLAGLSGRSANPRSSVKRYLPPRGLRPAKLAALSPQLNAKLLHANVRVFDRKRLENFPGLVLAAIVGDDDLVGNFQWLDRRADRLDELAQVAFLVVNRG